MIRFAVTSEIVTPESAAEGCLDEEQSQSFGAMGLRDAVKTLHETRTAHVGGVECITGDYTRIQLFNSMEFLTGAHESRTLHIPPNVTHASARRIARLLGVQV
jgi:hypothetical protein